MLANHDVTVADEPFGAADSSADKAAGDDETHDLVRAFENLMHAQIAHDLFDAEFGEIAVAAVELQRLIGDLEARIGHEPFGHGAQHRGVRFLAVERRRRAPQEGARRFQFGRHVGEAELQRLKFVKPFAEGACRSCM